MKAYLSIAIILFFVGCKSVDMEKEKERLKQTDVEFSKLSQDRGRNEAFFSYSADNAVMLRPNSMPIKGKQDLKEKLFSLPDTAYSLTWKPTHADIAESGDLGYTYGIWEYKTINENDDTIVAKGTYCSIWKKDEEGNWKWVLDTGNEGIGAGE